MTSKRRKPSTPAEIAAKIAKARAASFGAAGLQAEAASLAANESIDITTQGGTNRGGRKAATLQIMRLDAFSALRDTLCPGGYDAIRKFERDLTVSRGEHDRGRGLGLERVDCEGGRDRTDAMIAALGVVEAVRARMGQRAGWLVTELLDPSAVTRLKATTWRDIVAYITGEVNPVAQASRVRAAVEEVVAAYKADERPARIPANTAA